jgi:hypothetical protein
MHAHGLVDMLGGPVVKTNTGTRIEIRVGLRGRREETFDRTDVVLSLLFAQYIPTSVRAPRYFNHIDMIAWGDPTNSFEQPPTQVCSYFPELEQQRAQRQASWLWLHFELAEHSSWLRTNQVMRRRVRWQTPSS